MRRVRPFLPFVSLALAGCAHAALQYGRDGLAPMDHVVRANLATGQFGSAYEASLGGEARVRDRLLRNLTVGALGLYASRTDSSVWALDRAWAITEDRWTKRVSAGAAAAVVNDYVLPYTPGRTERLFIPFYGALTWLARGSRDDAAVEARRLSSLLGEAAADAGGAGDDELRGVMHYVSGAVFEAAGDRSAAEVSYRNAERLVAVPVACDTTVPDSLLGDVVVVVEQGFVGHPVPRDETVWVSRGEYTDLRRQPSERDGVSRRVGVREGTRALGWGYTRGAVMDVGLSLNWSEFRSGRQSAPLVSVSAMGASQELASGGNVTRAVRADFERGQPARFSRALVRAAVRATLYKAADDQLSKVGSDARDKDTERGKGEARKSGNSANAVHDGTGGNASDDTSAGSPRVFAAVGRAVLGIGLFAMAAASDANDVPDLRSWNLLPHDVRVVRLRLPAGEQDVHAMVNGQQVTVGRVLVRAGTVSVLPYRAFGDPR